jgi:8-oxo-dGTP diphosphatase
VKQLDVVAGVIFSGDQVLCAKRGPDRHGYLSGRYEFPGGKVEPGETACEALARELKEELDLDVIVQEEDILCTTEHEYPDFAVAIRAYVLRIPGRDLTLNEHDGAVWRSPEGMEDLDWAPADIPIVEELVRRHAEQP